MLSFVTATINRDPKVCAEESLVVVYVGGRRRSQPFWEKPSGVLNSAGDKNYLVGTIAITIATFFCCNLP